jgi:hypothetical protein
MPEGHIFCSQCGQKHPENNHHCEKCQAPLHEPLEPQPASNADDGTIGGLIPFRNAQALWAYYLAIFSLVPCIGIPLGISAVILGILGLRYLGTFPQARGKGHSLTGIILGGFCSLANIILLTLMLIGISVG